MEFDPRRLVLMLLVVRVHRSEIQEVSLHFDSCPRVRCFEFAFRGQVGDYQFEERFVPVDVDFVRKDVDGRLVVSQRAFAFPAFAAIVVIEFFIRY